MRSESETTVIKRTRQGHATSTSSGRRRRPRTGLLPALLLIALMLGVMACLPVPVGDPEKSRVDKGMSGAWRVGGDDEEQMVLVLDPYDKRTWLMTMIGLRAIGGDVADDDKDTGQQAPQATFSAATADGFKVQGVAVYKGWLTRIKDETFMTWETKTLSETLPGMAPKEWWVFRVRKSGEDTFYLDSFDYSIDGLDEVKTRAEAENIIRRHIGDPGFFKVEDSPRLDRLPAGDIAALPRLLNDFGLKDSM